MTFFIDDKQIFRTLNCTDDVNWIMIFQVCFEYAHASYYLGEDFLSWHLGDQNKASTDLWVDGMQKSGNDP